MGLQTDAVDLPRTRRKITQPLGGTVSLIMRIILAGLILPPLIGLLHDGRVNLYGFGLGSACATVTVNGLAESGSQSLAQLRPGTFSTPGTVNLCANHPTLGQRLLVTLTQVPTTALWLVLLILLWLLIRTVRRSGPFDIAVTRRLRFLAWFVLAASLAVTALQSYAEAAFTATAYRPSADIPVPVPVVQDTINGVLSTNWIMLLLVVCGLLTLARIIRIGAQMHDDLAGTV